MIQNKNAGIAILQNAQARPENVAILSEDGAVTYAKLLEISISMALHMQQHRVDQHATIAIKSNDLLVVLASLIASSLLGCRWVRATSNSIDMLAQDITHIFQTMEGEDALTGAFVIDSTWATPPREFQPDSKPRFSGYLSENHAWIIAQTSGTTGAPKLLEVSHQVMFDRARSAADDFQSFVTKSVCLFPITSFPYVTRALAALVNNATIVQSYNPVFWENSEVTLVTASQNQILDILTNTSLKTKVPTLHLGGAPLVDKVAVDMLGNFETVVDLYGSTETNRVFKNIKSIGPDGALVTRPGKLGSTVQIVDENDQPIAGSEQGIVRIQNGYMVRGYLDNATAEATSFRNGWFYPGDIGYWSQTGALVIVGRLNDQFNIGGVKLNAVSIDAAIQSVIGVKDAISFVIVNEIGRSELFAFLVLAVEHDKSSVEVAARQACALAVDRVAAPTKFLYANTLPRSENGKPNRKACEMLVLASAPT